MFYLRNLVPRTYILKYSCVHFSSAALPKEDKIKIGKYVISYVKVGNGPHNVFCAPGAMGTKWTDYKLQIQGFMHDKFTVVSWDPPGCGSSYPPEREFSDGFLEKDADLAHELMKVLEIPKYSVLGFSDGGNTSLILAAKYPNVVDKLVIWGANSFILPNELEAYHSIKDITKWSKRLREPLIEIYGEERLTDYWNRWLKAMVHVCVTRNGNICSEYLKNIKCPTYILYGEKDPLVDKIHASHLHTHIDGSRIHLYPEGKHHIHLTYTEDFNKRVQDFLLNQ